jgi:glucose uptake protein GlcU
MSEGTQAIILGTVALILLVSVGVYLWSTRNREE